MRILGWVLGVLFSWIFIIPLILLILKDGIEETIEGVHDVFDWIEEKIKGLKRGF